MAGLLWFKRDKEMKYKNNKDVLAQTIILTLIALVIILSVFAQHYIATFFLVLIFVLIIDCFV